MYYIDGNNVQGAAGMHIGTDEAEDALTDLVADWTYDNAKRALLFFDGHRGDIWGYTVNDYLTVYYPDPQDRSADDILLRKLELDENPRSSTVVTNDYELKKEIREMDDIPILSCADFVEWLHGHQIALDVDENPQAPQTEKEVEKWLQIFNEK